MEYSALLQRGSNGPVQTVFQEQFAVPLHDVSEQVTIKGRVLGQQGVQVELTPRRDQLVQPDLSWRDLRPTA